MDQSLAQLLDLAAQIVPNRYLQALLIIVAFAVVAKIADIIMTRFLERLFRKTNLTLDEQILEIFHRPIFVSIMLFGLALAADRLNLSQKINFVTLSGLKTIATFLWTAAFARFLKLMIGVVGRDNRRFHLIHERTLPLFSNLCMILIEIPFPQRDVHIKPAPPDPGAAG